MSNAANNISYEVNAINILEEVERQVTLALASMAGEEDEVLQFEVYLASQISLKISTSFVVVINNAWPELVYYIWGWLKAKELPAFPVSSGYYTPWRQGEMAKATEQVRTQVESQRK